MPLESHSLQHPGRGRSHGLEWLRGNKYFPGWGADVFAPLWLWMATILVRVFVDATCMMSPYGTAWRRQKEEAGAECGFHFQAMRQRVGLVVCSGSCEGLGPWKADGVGRILNQVLLGPGQFCGSWLLMAWGADGWLPFYSVCGNLWIPVMAMAGFTPWQLLLGIWSIFCSSQSWRANDRHSCLSLLALVGWPWVNAMLRMALLALLVAGSVKG